jgi:chromosome segregation ATPase
VVSLKEAGRKIEEQYKSMQAKSKAKDGEILQLKHQNQDSHAKLDSLAAELQRSQGEVTSMNGSLQNMQQRNAQLGAALKEVQTQQEEMTSYSASLQDIEASQL